MTLITHYTVNKGHQTCMALRVHLYSTFNSNQKWLPSWLVYNWPMKLPALAWVEWARRVFLSASSLRASSWGQPGFTKFTKSVSPERNGSGHNSAAPRARVYEFHEVESVLPRVELEDPEANSAEQNCWVYKFILSHINAELLISLREHNNYISCAYWIIDNYCILQKNIDLMSMIE